MKAINLRTEYLTKPIGLGCQKPVFSWECTNGIYQTAYQFVARCGNETLFDTGKAPAADSCTLPWPEEPLKSRQRIDWSLRLWDEKDQAGEWSHSFFEMGLLKAADWQAKWISAFREHTEKIRYPVDYFRKRFSVTGEVLSARLYATAQGTYDVTINQNLLTDAILAPGFFDYRKRIYVQAYDITAYLKENNTCIIRLANGHVGSLGKETSCLLQIELRYQSGETVIFGTDSTWDWCCDGPLRFADLQNGETYNETYVPSYAGHAMEVKSPEAPLEWIAHEPSKIQESLSPVRILPNQVIDFGRTLTGLIRITVPACIGKRFTVFLSDRLNEKGFVDLTGLQVLQPVHVGNFFKKAKSPFTRTMNAFPRQEIHITCADHGFVYQTSFSLFTFRYAQIIGDVSVSEIQVEALPVRSCGMQDAVFQSNNEFINTLYQNAVRTLENTMIGTACTPLRGHSGSLLSVWLSQDVLSYLFDDIAYQREWLKKLADAQRADGSFPFAMPGVSFTEQSGFGIICCALPLRLYRQTGDQRILQDAWPMVKRYAAYLLRTAGQKAELSNELNSALYRWKNPIPRIGQAPCYSEQVIDPAEFGTAYFYDVMQLTTEIAQILEIDSTPYQSIALRARNAYRALYGQGGALQNVPLEQLARAICIHILNADEERIAMQTLADRIGHEPGGMGHIAQAQLLRALNSAKQNALALSFIERSGYPGWADQIARGATTCWENWDGKGDRCCAGAVAVAQWIVSGLVGFYRRQAHTYIWEPSFAVPHVRFSYAGIRVCWQENNQLSLHIPAGTTVELRLPNQKDKLLSAGDFQITVPQ